MFDTLARYNVYGVEMEAAGIYPIAANEPHTRVVGWVLTTLQENAVSVRAR